VARAGRAGARVALGIQELLAARAASDGYTGVCVVGDRVFASSQVARREAVLTWPAPARLKVEGGGAMWHVHASEFVMAAVPR